MSQLNANTPYIECYIRHEYIYGPKEKGLTEGYIFGVKSMLNRPMHFHFQSCLGAIFWQMPISAFASDEKYDKISEDEEKRLSILQTWDCQANNIAVTTFSFLQNKRVDVFCRDKKYRSGKYIFTIDWYKGNDLLHLITLKTGRFALLPSHKIKFDSEELKFEKYEKIRDTWKV